ncbi:MAG: c-type cytochrome [Alphaproteobacteria bacterium]|nr:c-type cytochrome [Alphaproteobacteria bacterium]
MPSAPAEAKATRPLWRSMTVWASAVAGALVLGYGVYTVLSEVRPGANPDDAEQVALGRQVYGRECASCHGDRLQGQPNWRQRNPNGRLPAPPHDETGHTWHHPDELLFTLTKQGPQALARPGYQSDMPAYAGKLSDNEIWAVLAFIKSHWSKDIRERQEAITRRAREQRDRKR